MLFNCSERGRNRIGRREKWPKQSWEEGEIGGKSREEGEIEKLKFREEGLIGSKSREEGEIGSKSREEGETGSKSREKGDLPPVPPPSSERNPRLFLNLKELKAHLFTRNIVNKTNKACPSIVLST